MRVTKEYLLSHMTSQCGITRKQLEALGLPWPPVAGWKSRIIGKEITYQQKTAFELASKRKKNRKKSKNREPIKVSPIKNLPASAVVGFVITREYIFNNTTPGGSWNYRQLEALGIECPPESGWIDRLAGKKISLEAKDRFEYYSQFSRSKSAPDHKSESLKFGAQDVF